MNKNDNKTNPCIDIILLKRTDYKNENMNENKKKAKISKIIELFWVKVLKSAKKPLKPG